LQDDLKTKYSAQFLNFFTNEFYFTDIQPTLFLFSWSGCIYPPPTRIRTQTGQEEIWPSGRNEKNQSEKSNLRTFEMNQKQRKIGELRNSCRVIVGGVGVEAIMTIPKIGADVRD